MYAADSEGVYVARSDCRRPGSNVVDGIAPRNGCEDWGIADVRWGWGECEEGKKWVGAISVWVFGANSVKMS